MRDIAGRLILNVALFPEMRVTTTDNVVQTAAYEKDDNNNLAVAIFSIRVIKVHYKNDYSR